MFIVEVGIGDFFVVFMICCILVVLKYKFGMIIKFFNYVKYLIMFYSYGIMLNLSDWFYLLS